MVHVGTSRAGVTQRFLGRSSSWDSSAETGTPRHPLQAHALLTCLAVAKLGCVMFFYGFLFGWVAI